MKSVISFDKYACVLKHENPETLDDTHKAMKLDIKQNIYKH